MNSNVDARIRQTGLRLYELMEERSGTIFRKEYWTGKLFEWCTHNEFFKVQMFRFMDVFPALARPDSVGRHIREYFSDPRLNFPSAVQWGIKFVSPEWMSSGIIARSIGANITRLARQFIAGPSAEESLPVLENLRAQGMAVSIDLLGEAVLSEMEADDYLRRYLLLLDFLDGAQTAWTALGGAHSDLDWGSSPRVNISLKASAMYSQMNACAFEHSIERAKVRLRPLLRKAMETRAFVYLDMEHHALKDLTLALYRSLMEEPELRGYPHTGIVIQAYLHESESDLLDMIRWAKDGDFKLTVRLVKGAYWDQEVIHAGQNNWPVPVFTNKSRSDANFEHLARIILANRERIKLACASHNIRSIASVIETARDLGCSEKEVEFQVLFGMGEPIAHALRAAGLPVRVYSPVGEMLQGMSYLVRRLLENTANESFLRQTFSQSVPRSELLKDPAGKVEDHEAITRPPAPAAAPYGDRGAFRIEPPLDWSHAGHRKLFAGALQAVRSRFPIRVPIEIADERVAGAQDFKSLNPNSAGEVVGIVASAGLSEARQAISAAGAAFAKWRDTAPCDRADFLFRAAEAARRSRYELAALQVFEVGKAWSEADGDVCEAIDYLEYYGREMIRYGRPRRMERAPGEVSYLAYEPRGVAVVIAPWNFPMAISTGMCSAAIVAGNTVVYKPASQSPVTGAAIARIFRDAGLPPGVFNFLPGPGGELGDFLVTHPDVALIAFTGSKEVGLHIYEQAAKTPPGAAAVKNLVLEMGGKNAIIVDADADLDEAVAHIIRSAFGYQGQKCSACSRLIVLEENHDRLLVRLKAAAQSIHIGPVEDPKNFMGAVVDPATREKILRYIEIGRKEASVLIERTAPGLAGNFVPLAVFTGVQPGSRLAREEIFGPVLAVIKVKDFDEALSVANGTEYALTGAVFSRSPGNIEKARREFRTGNLYINRGCTGAIVGRHPFGGFKMSGLGSKAGGPDYLLHFMVPRVVAENTVRRGFAPSDEEESGHFG